MGQIKLENDKRKSTINNLIKQTFNMLEVQISYDPMTSHLKQAIKCDIDSESAWSLDIFSIWKSRCQISSIICNLSADRCSYMTSSTTTPKRYSWTWRAYITYQLIMLHVSHQKGRYLWVVGVSLRPGRWLLILSMLLCGNEWLTVHPW